MRWHDQNEAEYFACDPAPGPDDLMILVPLGIVGGIVPFLLARPIFSMIAYFGSWIGGL